MSQTAKLFINGRSHAVRLPAAFRFDAKEVFVRQDRETGDIVLSRRPADWESFLTLLKSSKVPAGFLGPKERQQATQLRDPLDGIDE